MYKLREDFLDKNREIGVEILNKEIAKISSSTTDFNEGRAIIFLHNYYEIKAKQDALSKIEPKISLEYKSEFESEKSKVSEEMTKNL